MNDMSRVIVPKSDQINADSLLSGPLTITVSRVVIKPGTEQPVAISFDGDDGKPYKPCKSMCRVMVQLWGADANQYVGRSMTLYNDPKVLWGGMAVGGIRISHMSHIGAPMTMALTATKGNKKPFTVKPLALVQPAVAPPVSQPATPTALGKAEQAARDLFERVHSATGTDELQAITMDATVKKQREWLAQHRPELAARVDAAITDALTVFERMRLTTSLATGRTPHDPTQRTDQSDGG